MENEYVLICSEQLVGACLSIFIRGELVHKITNVDVCTAKVILTVYHHFRIQILNIFTSFYFPSFPSFLLLLLFFRRGYPEWLEIKEEWPFASSTSKLISVLFLDISLLVNTI